MQVQNTAYYAVRIGSIAGIRIHRAVIVKILAQHKERNGNVLVSVQLLRRGSGIARNICPRRVHDDGEQCFVILAGLQPHICRRRFQRDLAQLHAPLPSSGGFHLENGKLLVVRHLAVELEPCHNADGVLGGVLLAQHLNGDILTQVDRQAAVIAIQYSACTCRQLRHIVGQIHRLAEQTVRKLTGYIVLQQITAVGILELLERSKGFGRHRPAGIRLIDLLDLCLQLDQLIGSDSRCRCRSNSSRRRECTGRLAGGAIQQLLFKEQRDLLCHLVDDEVGDIEHAVVLHAVADQGQRTGQIAAQIDRGKLTGISGQLGKLGLVADGNVMRGVRLAPYRHLESTVHAVDSRAGQDRAAVAHSSYDAIRNAGRNNRAVVCHGQILFTSTQFGCAAEHIIDKGALLCGSTFLRSSRCQSVGGAAGTFLALDGCINGAQLVLCRVELCGFFLGHGAALGIRRADQGFHVLTQLLAALHQCFQIGHLGSFLSRYRLHTLAIGGVVIFRGDLLNLQRRFNRARFNLDLCVCTNLDRGRGVHRCFANDQRQMVQIERFDLSQRQVVGTRLNIVLHVVHAEAPALDLALFRKLDERFIGHKHVGVQTNVVLEQLECAVVRAGVHMTVVVIDRYRDVARSADRLFKRARLDLLDDLAVRRDDRAATFSGNIHITGDMGAVCANFDFHSVSPPSCGTCSVCSVMRCI
nr:MAG TPA: hypothetical protein [Caudoviricetes sp.]